VLRQSSEVLDERVQEFELPTDDPHLSSLLSKALQHFYDRREDRRWDGLRCMVDAYERLKSVEEPANKKASVAKLIGQLPMAQRLAAHYDALLAELTGVGNDQTIRHHEHGKTVLADPAVMEFLFYAYFGVVRLILESRGGAAPK
jgi:hypothetical protein